MTFDMPLEGGKIREFAIATRSNNPAYRAGAEAVVTPTFLTTARYWWTDGVNAFPSDFDLMRVLHAEEEFIFHGPPPKAGQTLTVTARIGDRYEKEGGRGGKLRFAVMIHEFRNADGELVAEERMTLVETGRAPVAESKEAGE